MSECPNVVLVVENWPHFNWNIFTSFFWAPVPSFLVRGFWGKRQGSCCWLGGWDLVSMWLYSVKPARKGRWTLATAEVASGEGDEVEQIADWQLSSITCPASQMQVDRKGLVGWNGVSYTVYWRCLFASQSLVECCLSLIHPTIYQSITFPGSSLYVTCSILLRCYRALALLHWYFLSQQATFAWGRKTARLANMTSQLATTSKHLPDIVTAIFMYLNGGKLWEKKNSKVSQTILKPLSWEFWNKAAKHVKEWITKGKWRG